MDGNSRKLSKSVIVMIINWLNKFKIYGREIASLKDLADGSTLLELFRIMTGDNIDSVQMIANISDSKQRFDIIQMAIEKQFCIDGSINYQAAASGHDYELALICLIILMCGFSQDLPKFVETADALDENSYVTFNLYFTLLEKAKVKNPPRELKIYHDFLCISNTTRKSISKDIQNNHVYSNSASCNTPRSSIHSVNHLLSPLTKACSINSPIRDSKHRKKYEEEIQRLEEEKKKIENHLANKENYISDLNDELNERQNQISSLLSKIEEYKRKIVELNNYKERAYECESLCEKVKAAEKERDFYLEKCNKYTNELMELKTLRDLRDDQQNQINKLTTELSKFDKKEQANTIEFQRLKNVESRLQTEIENNTSKESKILELINKVSELDSQILTLKERLNLSKHELSEKIEQLTNENASYQNEINSYRAQLDQLNEELASKIHDYEVAHELEVKKYNDLLNDLQYQKALEQETRSELTTLKIDHGLATKHVDVYKKELEATQTKIEGLQAEYRSYREEMNAKMNSANQKLEHLSNENGSLNKNFSKTQQQLSLAKEELEKQVNNLSQKLEEANQCNIALKTDLTTSQKELEYLKESTVFKNKEYEINLKEKINEINSLNKQLELNQTDFDAFKDNMNSIKDEMESKIEILENELKVSNSNYLNLESNFQKLTQESHTSNMSYESKLNELNQINYDLNQRLNDLKNQSEEKVNQLESNNKDLNTKLNEQYEANSRLKQEMDNQLNNLNSQLNQEREENQSKQSEMRSNIENLLIEKSELLSNIDDLNNNLTRLQETLTNEKQEMEEKINDANNKLEQKSQDFNNLQKYLNDFQNDKDEEIKQYEIEAENLKNELDKERENCENKSQEIIQINEQLKKVESMLETETEARNKETMDSNLKINLLNDELKVKSDEIAKLETQLTEEAKKYETKLDELSNEFSQKEERVANYVNELQEAHASETNRLKSEINDITSQLDSKKSEYEDMKQSIEQSNQQIITLNENIQLLTNDLNGKNNDYAQLEQNFNDLNSKLKSKENELVEKENQFNSLLSSNKDTYECQIANLKENYSKLETLFNETITNKDQSLSALNEQINSLKNEFNQADLNNSEKFSQLQNTIRQIEGEKACLNEQIKADELNMNRMKEELSIKQVQLNESVNQINSLQLHITNIEKEYAKIIEIKSKETSELVEANRKINELELRLNQLVVDKENLTKNFDEKKNQHSALSAKLVEQTKSIEVQFRNMDNELKIEKEKNSNFERRLREEATTKQAEIDQLKTKLDEKERYYLNIINEAGANLKQAKSDFEKQKESHESLNEQVSKLKQELNTKSALNEDLFSQVKSLKEFNVKFEEHYKIKKKIFEDAETHTKEMDKKMKDIKLRNEHLQRDNDRLTKETSELQNKLIHDESRVRNIIEELNFLKEKVKTLTFENQQLKVQKEDMAKKMNEISILPSSIDTSSVRNPNITSTVKSKQSSTTSSNLPPSLPQTPKSKFYDDSFVKLTSPDFRTNIDQDMNNDNDSRRYSMDSFARVSASNSSTLPAFNRFNAISENEFEEPSINQKFLQIDNSQVQMNRLSTLQIRNQQSKPHLKSSYALESLLPAVTENQVRGEKENVAVVSRVSDISSKSFLKRRHDDTSDAKTPKKSNTSSGNTTLKQSNV